MIGSSSSCDDRNVLRIALSSVFFVPDEAELVGASTAHCFLFVGEHGMKLNVKP